jgi:hypothetical protein
MVSTTRGWSAGRQLNKGLGKIIVFTFDILNSNLCSCTQVKYQKHRNLTDRKENQISLINKEIQKGSVANSYMNNYL